MYIQYSYKQNVHRCMYTCKNIDIIILYSKTYNVILFFVCQILMSVAIAIAIVPQVVDACVRNSFPLVMKLMIFYPTWVMMVQHQLY